MTRFSFIRKCAAFLLIALLIAPASLSLRPTTAHAAWPVSIVGGDVMNWIQNFLTQISTYKALGEIVTGSNKEFVLDPIAWAMSQAVIQEMTGSVVNFVNGNGNGSGQSQFVRNLSVHLQKVGDNQALAFLGALSSEIPNSPFAAAITSSLRGNYAENTSLAGFFASKQCTLNAVSSNINSFLAGNFRDGGWAAWLELTTKEQNNPFMFYETAKAELANVVGSAQAERSATLSWGQGFLSWCPNGTPEGAQCLNSDGTSVSMSTPGSVIKDELTKALGSGIDKLIAADEINEFIGTLAIQFFTDALGGLSGGLSDQSARASGFITNSTTFSPDEMVKLAEKKIALAASYRSAWQIIDASAQDAQAGIQGIIDTIDSHLDAAGHATTSPYCSYSGAYPHALTREQAVEAMEKTSGAVRESARKAFSVSAETTTKAKVTIDSAKSIDSTNASAISQLFPLAQELQLLPPMEGDVDRAIINSGSINVLDQDVPDGNTIRTTYVNALPIGSLNVPLEERNGATIDQMSLVRQNADAIRAYMERSCYPNTPKDKCPNPKNPYYPSCKVWPPYRY